MCEADLHEFHYLPAVEIPKRTFFHSFALTEGATNSSTSKKHESMSLNGPRVSRDVRDHTVKG